MRFARSSSLMICILIINLPLLWFTYEGHLLRLPLPEQVK
jgi:hypothetical protein